MLEKQAEDFRKMRSGDMKAFERLFVSLYPGLCNIANHYLNNEMLSKDVAQDAFIKSKSASVSSENLPARSTSFRWSRI